MSTEIKSVMVGTRLNVSGDTCNLGRVGVDIEGLSGGSFNRADFLAAVAAECNVIVIPREELPEVEDSHGGGPKWKSVGDELYPLDRGVAEYRDTAHRLIAMAEYLDAHPPVDEAQVEALAKRLLLHRFAVDGRSVEEMYRDIARRLIADGVTVKGIGNE